MAEGGGPAALVTFRPALGRGPGSRPGKVSGFGVFVCSGEKFGCMRRSASASQGGRAVRFLEASRKSWAVLSAALRRGTMMTEDGLTATCTARAVCPSRWPDARLFAVKMNADNLLQTARRLPDDPRRALRKALFALGVVRAWRGHCALRPLP